MSAQIDRERWSRFVDAVNQRGRAAHPEIVIDERLLSEHLACSEDARSKAIDEGGCLHYEDLFLCCAALARDRTAIALLRRRMHEVIARYVRYVDPNPDFVDEVEQRFWCGALLSSGDAPPKLSSYSGRSPLAGWTGVSAQRIAFNLLRQGEVERRSAQRQRIEIERVASDPEVAFIKTHLRARYRGAIAGALETLDQHERLIYRLHLVDGLSLERIGRMYGVSHSTISRRLSAARARMVTEVQRLLGDAAERTSETTASLARFLDSQLELSISRLLAGAPFSP